MDPQARDRRKTVVIVVALAALVFFSTACTCCFVPEAVRRAGSFGRAMPWRNGIGSWSGQAEAREEISQRFDVSGAVSLELRVAAGDVQVEPGTGDEVVVTGRKHAYGADSAAAEARLREFRVDVRQEAPATIIIETDGLQVGEVRSPRVDLVVRVPRRADVQAVVNAGSLRVEGVEGTLDLVTNVGEVAARDVSLTGDSRLTCNVGTVSVRLPADASFQLEAKSGVGSVSCTFPLQDEHSSSTLVGRSLSGRVGEAPELTLTLQVNTGDVRVEQQ